MALNSCIFATPDPFLEDHGQQGSYHCGAALGTRRAFTPGRTLETKLNLFNNSRRGAKIAWRSFKINITGSNTLNYFSVLCAYFFVALFKF